MGQQNVVAPELNHISDNLMDDVGVVMYLIIWWMTLERVNFVGDYVVGHVDVESAAETFKDGAWKNFSNFDGVWKNFSNFDFLKFTQSSGENKVIGRVEIVRLTVIGLILLILKCSNLLNLFVIKNTKRR